MALARGWAERQTDDQRRPGDQRGLHWWRHIGVWLRGARLLAVEGHVEEPSGGARAAQATNAEFEVFFRRHERAIFTYLWRMTSDEQAAYDLSQEVFLRAWRHFDRIHDYELPVGWLFRVATNLAFNHRRSHAMSVRTLEEVDVEEYFARSDPTHRLGEDEAVRRALMALPARQRAALVLRAVHGMSCAEVAAALGVSRAAAKMLLFRGRDEFRQRYEREGGQL